MQDIKNVMFPSYSFQDSGNKIDHRIYNSHNNTMEVKQTLHYINKYIFKYLFSSGIKNKCTCRIVMIACLIVAFKYLPPHRM